MGDFKRGEEKEKERDGLGPERKKKIISKRRGSGGGVFQK